MPPGNAHGGDVLDRALAAAKTQTPAGKGFFNALKPNSPLFAQTTRVNVAHPEAQQRQQRRVVPEYTPPPPPAPHRTPQQAITATHAGRTGVPDIGGAVSSAAGYVAHHPFRAAASTILPAPLAALANPLVGKAAAFANTETNKGLGKLATVGQPQDLSGSASTNAGILNAAQGIPTASLSTAAQDKLRQAALFFGAHPTYHYDVPNLGLFGPKDKAAYKLAPTATDADYIRAIGQEVGGLGHRGYISSLLHNVPLNAIQLAAAPVGAAYLLTHPISGGKEFAKEQVQFGKDLVEHPLNTLKTQPVTTATTLLALGRGAGGFAGTLARTGAAGEAARAFATPAERKVVPAGRDLIGLNGETIRPPAIPRGMTSTKLDERLAQAASDKLAANVPFFGNRLDRSFRNDITRGANQTSSQVEQAALDPAIRAASKLNRHEVRDVTAFTGQGFHSLGEAVAYYTKRAAAHRAEEQAAIDHVGTETHADWKTAQQYLDNQQKLAEGLHKKIGDIPTAKMSDALTKLTGATRASEQQLAGMSRQGTTLPLVPEDTMLRRSYMPRAQIESELYGTPAAQNLLKTTHELNALHPEIQKAPENALPSTATNEIDRIQREQASDLGKQLKQAQRKLDRARTLKRKVAPGQKPTLKASPGQIRQLEKRVGALADAKARVESGDYANSRINQLQGRAVPTRQQLEDTRAQISDEQAAALHQVRSQFRSERGAPPVEPNAPLDVHDPLFFQHVMEGTKGLRGVFRGQGKGMMNENTAGRFGGGRLGHEGQQSTSQMFADARASTDPHVYFGGVAKPFKVAAALRHFRAQVEQSIIAPKAGTIYDTTQWVRIRADGGGAPNTDVPTTTDASQAIHELSDQSLRDKIMGGIVPENKGIQSHIPDDGHEYYLMSRHAADNLENTFKGYDSKTLRALKRTTGLWRWATLMARPAWLVNNVAGNTIQALTGGAGPVSMGRALRTGPGQKYEGIVQPGSQNTGFFRNTFDRPAGLGSTAMAPIHAFTNFVVDANVRFENFMRRALDLSQASHEAKSALHGELGTIRSGFHRMTPEVIDYMKKPTPEAAERIVKRVTDWQGNFTKLKSTPILDVVAPFHRWFTFIGKLILEMPVKTPGRALFLQRLGQFGINIQSQAFGGFVPNSLQGSIKLPESLPVVGGLYKSTQGLNPYTTALQLLSPNDQSTTDPGQVNPQGLLGALNPGFGALWNWGAGTDFQTGYGLKDQYGNPVGHGNPGVLAHGLENAVPFYSLLHGYNTADNAANPFSPAPAQVSATAQQPASFGLRALGYLGGSVRPFDTELNRDKSIKRLKTAVIAEAKNKLAHS